MSRLLQTLARNIPRLINAQTAPRVCPGFFKSFSVCHPLAAPKVQQLAPDFKGIAVVDGCTFKEIQLCDYKGKYLVLMFYPLDFTFVCPTEIVALDNYYEKFQSLNTEVIGISIDSHFSHLAWMNMKRQDGGVGKLRYPLLSDINKTIARSYDVLLDKDGVALRGLFIIDPYGVLRVMSVNDLPIGRSVDEIIRLLEALQFVEKHGEVCPANWKPNSKTIKPDPTGSKEYFQSEH